MKPETISSTPSDPGAELDRLKKLEELIARQGVRGTATFEHLLGTGADLWKDEEELCEFLATVKNGRLEEK